MWRHGCPQHRRHQAHYTWVMIIHWEHQESQTAVRHTEIKVWSRWRLVISSLCPDNKCQVSKLTSQVRAVSFHYWEMKKQEKERNCFKIFPKSWENTWSRLYISQGDTDLRNFLKLGRFFHERNGTPQHLQLVQKVLWGPQCNTSLLLLWDPRAALPKQEPLHRQNRSHCVAKIGYKHSL